MAGEGSTKRDWRLGEEGSKAAAVAAVVFSVALAPRLWGVFGREPSLGETAACTALTLDFMTVLTGSLSEQCPPVFHALFRPLSWLTSGALEALRMQSALISAGACAAALAAFRPLLGAAGALLAALVLSVHPAAVASGRVVGPEVLVLPGLVLCLYYLVRTIEANRLRHWLLLDLGLVLLFTSHRGAMVAAAGVLMVHLGLIVHRAFFPPKGSWLMRPHRLLRRLAVHYVLTVLLSLPLAVVILRNPMFPTPAVDWHVWVEWAGALFLAGADGGRGWLATAAIVAGGVLILPGVVAMVVTGFSGEWKRLVALAWLVSTLAVVWAISHAPGGFKFHGVDLAGLTVCGLALLVGGALARARRPIQLVAMALLAGGWTANGAPRHGPPLPIRPLMARVSEIRAEGERVVVWPPYLAVPLRFYLGSKAGDGDLDGLVHSIEETPPESRTHFVLVRWPENSARTITLRGAVELLGKDVTVWKAGPYGEVISARSLDRQRLGAWLADPRTLNTDDRPVPRLTMHMWLPTDPLFSDGRMFHQSPAEALFEPSGRRVVWTAREEVTVEPRVNLPQGSYYVKVHCSPVAEGAEPRQMDVVVSAFERRQFRLTGDDTLTLRFTTAEDLMTLPIRISAQPMFEAGSGRFRRSQGLKIYSISVEATQPLD